MPQNLTNVETITERAVKVTCRTISEKNMKRLNSATHDNKMPYGKTLHFYLHVIHL